MDKSSFKIIFRHCGGLENPLLSLVFVSILDQIIIYRLYENVAKLPLVVV